MNPRLKDALFGHAEIKTAERRGGDLYIEGVASTGQTDRANEIVDQESLRAAAETYTTRTIFHQHNWHAPVGEAVGMRFEDDQFIVRGKIGHDYDIPIVVEGPFGPMGVAMTSVNNIRKQIEQNVLRAFSIGFTAVREVQKDEDGRPDESKPAVLKVEELLELSIVTIPANRDCLFSLAKSYRYDEIFSMYPQLPANMRRNSFVSLGDHSSYNLVGVESFAFGDVGDGITSDGEEWDEVIGGIDRCLSRLKSTKW